MEKGFKGRRTLARRSFDFSPRINTILREAQFAAEVEYDGIVVMNLMIVSHRDTAQDIHHRVVPAK